MQQDMENPGKHASHEGPSLGGVPMVWNNVQVNALELGLSAFLAQDAIPLPDITGHVSHLDPASAITANTKLNPTYAEMRPPNRLSIATNADRDPTGDTSGEQSTSTQLHERELAAETARYIRSESSGLSWPVEVQQSFSHVAAVSDNTFGWVPTSTTMNPDLQPHSSVAAGPLQHPGRSSMASDFQFDPAMPSQFFSEMHDFLFTSNLGEPQIDVPAPAIVPPWAPMFDVKPDPSWPGQNQAGPSADVIATPSALVTQCLATPSPASQGSRPAAIHPSPPQSRPSPPGQKRVTKNPPPLEIIMVKPNSNPAESPSRKRPAADALTSRTVKKVFLDGANGEACGSLMTIEFGPTERHRSKFTPEKRAETNLARREGVCQRCHMSKRKCDLAMKDSPYVPCTRCATSKLYKGISPMPCFKATLSKIVFFRAGPAENEPLFTDRFKSLAILDISMPNVPVRDIYLTQRIGNHKLMVYASEFTALPNDKVYLKWKNIDGTQHQQKMPTFCLTNILKVTAQMQHYIANSKRAYFEALLKDEELVSMTVKMAIKYAHSKPKTLVGMALDLWAISRIIEIEWEMCGPDTLGVKRFSDPLNPRNGKIPIPPMMDTQLDQIVIHNVLNPLRKDLLDQLEARISPFKREDWFDIYLTSFIVLNHIERLAKHSAYHAELHNMTFKFSNIPFLESVFHSAKVILSRFHFVCRGSGPLLLDWDKPQSAEITGLDAEQTAFMKQTQVLVKEKETGVVRLRARHEYEKPLYWCGQLFTENWDNSPAQVVADKPPPRVIEVE